MSKAASLLAALAVTITAAAQEDTAPPWPPIDAPETLEFARVLTVRWEPPQQRLNGVPLDPKELSHYELILKDNARQHPYTIASTETSAEHIVAAVGEHCAVIRAVDSDGLPSPWSEQACKTLRSGPARMTLTIGEPG